MPFFHSRWTIEPVVRKTSVVGGDNTNIKFIAFRDSTYAFDAALRKIEDSGKQGEKVLLEGIKTGSSKVIG